MQLRKLTYAFALLTASAMPFGAMAQSGAYFDADANLLYLPEVDAGNLGSFAVNLAVTSTTPLRFEIQEAVSVESTGQPVAMYRTDSNSLSVFSAAVGNQFFNAELQNTAEGFEVMGLVEDESAALLNSAPVASGSAWNVIGGNLKQVSVGTPQHVWGVNSNNEIFRRDGNIWTNIGGTLKQVSVGCDGVVWGVNPADEIFRWDGAGTGWTNISGRLTQISVGNALNVWGVNASDEVFRRDGDTWTQIPGGIKHVSVGCDGEVWGVDSSDAIFRRNHYADDWTHIGGSLKQIEVGDTDHVWGVNAAGAVFKWNRAAANWTHMPGLLQQVSVTSNGAAVWGIQTGDVIVTGSSVLAAPEAIQQRTGTLWNEVSGSLKQISVGSAAHIWGVNLYDDIFQRSGNSWVHVAGKLKQVSVGCDGTTWGVNGGDYIFRRDGGGWTEIDGRLKQISVGNASHIWGVNYQDNVFQWNGSGWTGIDGKLKQISVGCDGTVWGVNSRDEIFRRDGGGWTGIGGNLKQISVGNANQVWGVNAIDDIFQWTASGWVHIGGKAKHVAVGNDGTVWGIKDLSGIPKPRLGLLGIDLDFDGTYERVLQITDYSGNKILIHKPLAILYIMQLFGIQITQAVIDNFSPIQQQALAAQNLTGLTWVAASTRSSGSQLVMGADFNLDINLSEMSLSDIGVSSPTWTSENMTRQFGGGTDYTVAGSGALLSYQGFDNNLTFFGVEGQAGVMAIDGFAPIPGGGVNVYIMQAGVDYGNAGSLSVTAGSANAQAYVNSQGMAVGAGVTAVAVDGSLGRRDSSHVVAGVGAGVGGGAAAAWGQNGQYGFEMDVKFIKVGAYVSGNDAKPVFNKSTGWLRNAASNTAGWSTTAWSDTSNWFENTAGSAQTAVMRFTDGTSDWAVNAFNDGKDVTINIVDGASSVTVQIGNATSGAVTTVTNGVDSALQTGGNVATDVGNTVKDLGNTAGSTISSTADTVVNSTSSGLSSAGNAIGNFFCGIFGC